jgi:hypothetical protein
MSVGNSLDQSITAKVLRAIVAESFDQSIIAKILGAILALYGPILFLVPQKSCNFYGTKDAELKDPMSPLVIDYMEQPAALAVVTGPSANLVSPC